MANGLPMMDPMMGNAGISRMPPADSMGATPSGPQDEVGQLLALREQIDQRLGELLGGQMPGADQMAAAGGMPAGPPPNGGMPPAGLLGAGPY